MAGDVFLIRIYCLATPGVANGCHQVIGGAGGVGGRDSRWIAQRGQCSGDALRNRLGGCSRNARITITITTTPASDQCSSSQHGQT